jgi:hypothetical protein
MENTFSHPSLNPPESPTSLEQFCLPWVDLFAI